MGFSKFFFSGATPFKGSFYGNSGGWEHMRCVNLSILSVYMIKKDSLKDPTLKSVSLLVAVVTDWKKIASKCNPWIRDFELNVIFQNHHDTIIIIIINHFGAPQTSKHFSMVTYHGKKNITRNTDSRWWRDFRYTSLAPNLSLPSSWHQHFHLAPTSRDCGWRDPWKLPENPWKKWLN